MRRRPFAIYLICAVLVVSSAVLTSSCVPTECTIEVKATLDGAVWAGAVEYTLTGPGAASPITGTSVEDTFRVDCGNWTCAYVSGGPEGAYLDDIAPSETQTVYNGGTITFTFNFKTGAKFIGHFVTPEGEPYPFDVIISDGTWRKEWPSVTYIETEVPVEDTSEYTLTYSYDVGNYREFNEVPLSLSPGEIKELEFYAIDLRTAEPRIRPYLYFQEVGASANLTWNWDSVTNTLEWNVSANPGKMVDIGALYEENIVRTPWWVVAAESQPWDWTAGYLYEMDPSKGMILSKGPQHKNLLQWPMSSATGYFSFAQIDPAKGVIEVTGVFDNDFKLGSFDMRLTSIESGQVVDPAFEIPQYAVPEGNYSLRIFGLPSPYAEVVLPVAVEAGTWKCVMAVYPPKTADLLPFGCGVAAELRFAQSTCSAPVHDTVNRTLTADVSTKALYDWWGYFVLPDATTVTNVALSYGDFGRILYEQEDYTIDHVDGYYVVCVRIEPEAQQLILHYAPAPAV
jgi:hypothetical protein